MADTMIKKELIKALQEARRIIEQSMSGSIFAGEQNKYYRRRDRWLKKYCKKE